MKASKPRLRTLGPMVVPVDGRTTLPPPKERDAELGTPAHRAWSLEVRRRAGWKCEDCGATGVRLHADHVVERQDGGALLDPANGRALCTACHTRKTAAARAARHGLI